ERADAVPQLQSREAQAPERLPLAAELVRELPAVVVADHVVGEDDESLASEIDGASGSRRELRVLETAVRPVAVRRKDGRKRAGALRAVQISGDVEARLTLEVDLRHRVVGTFLLVANLRAKRGLRKRGAQPRRRQD